MANQYINKIVYGGDVLLDLTSDDVTASDVLSGKKFHLPSGAPATGACAYDADTSDATAVAAELLEGKSAYRSGAKLTGTMPNRGAVAGVIAAVGQEYTVPQGYHDGSGKVAIDATEQAKLIPGNIRDGVVVLGVTGTMSGSEDVHAQAKTVVPSRAQQVVTPDSPEYNYLSQVTVEAIPYTETDNAAGGRGRT